MEKEDFNTILKKVDVKEGDIYSFAETWPIDSVMIGGVDTPVRGRFKYYEVALKNGKTFFLKLDHLTTDLQSIDKIVLAFM